MKNFFKNMAKKKKSAKELKDNKANDQVKDQTVEQAQDTDNESVKEHPGAEDTKDKKITKNELAEQKDKFLRLFAEFENYKKRTMRERIELLRTAAEDTMSVLLPVLDDFDRAKKNADDEENDEVFSEGITLIYNKLNSVLKQKGLEKMESTNADFDPELHEAIAEIPAPSDELKGKVIDTIESGYILKDKIIRHAKVVVGK